MKTEKEAERGKVDDSRQAPVVIARCLSNSKLLHSLSLNCFCLRMQKKRKDSKGRKQQSEGDGAMRGEGRYNLNVPNAKFS